MEPFVYIPAARVHELLDWDTAYEATEHAMASVAENRAFQNLRALTKLGNNSPNVMFTQVGYLEDDKYGALTCKPFPCFLNAKYGEKNVRYTMFLLDENSGDLKAVIDDLEATDWSTATASAVATKQLHGNKSDGKFEILAIFGAGNIAKIHAIGFQHFFKFKQVRIWNRTPKHAIDLVAELNRNYGEHFVAYDNAQECVKNADVIVTATSGDATLIKFDWLNLEKSVHINAIRVNPEHNELDDDIYRASDTYVDYNEGADDELNCIKKLGVQFKGQIGDVISGSVSVKASKSLTIFQSLGMAVIDCAMARMIYDLHLAKPT